LRKWVKTIIYLSQRRRARREIKKESIFNKDKGPGAIELQIHCTGQADNGWIKAYEPLTRIVILQRFRSDTSSPSGIKFIIYPL